MIMISGKRSPEAVGALIVSSFMGGIIQKTAMAPIGIFKSRAQANRLNVKELTTKIWNTEILSGNRTNTTNGSKRMKGMNTRLSGSRLLFSLWKGTGLSILKTGLYTMVHIPLFTLASVNPSRLEWERHINHTLNTPKWVGNMMTVGFVSWSTATFATTLTFPIDLIRSRYANRIEPLQTSGNRRQALISVVRELVHNRVFFRGLGSTIISTTPFNVMNGSMYFALKDAGYNTALSGAVAASLSSLITHPLDTVKERVKFADLNQNMNFLQMIRYLNQTQGYSNKDLQPGLVFNRDGQIIRMMRMMAEETAVNKGDEPYPPSRQQLTLKNCLSSTIKLESRWARGFKTYFSGVSLNLVKSGGTYASRWLLADVLANRLSSWFR